MFDYIFNSNKEDVICGITLVDWPKMGTENCQGGVPPRSSTIQHTREVYMCPCLNANFSSVCGHNCKTVCDNVEKYIGIDIFKRIREGGLGGWDQSFLYKQITYLKWYNFPLGVHQCLLSKYLENDIIGIMLTLSCDTI